MPHSGIAKRSAAAYSSASFWDAYIRIYFAGKSNPVVIESADSMLEYLLESATEDKYLYILCLGFGVGVFELPLLMRMIEALEERKTGKEIRLVAVDNCLEPLLAISKLLQKGWHDIPETAEAFASELKNVWPDPTELETSQNKTEWMIGDHLFMVLDLDTGRTQQEIDTLFGPHPEEKELARIFLNDAPSLWYSRLQSSLARNYPRPTEGDFRFNLVIASFIFQHLKYWQRAVVHSLAILRNKGILVFPRIGGDACLFEGKAPRSRRTAQNDMAKEVFGRFYRHEAIKRYWQRQRTINASDPIAVLDFFKRLENRAVEPLQSYEYKFDNPVPLESYWELLHMRGFSNLRRVEEEISKETYDDHVNQIKKQVEEDETCKQDTLQINIKWYTYRCNISDKFKLCPLWQKYLGENDRPTDSTNLHRSQFLKSFEYELFEATQLPPSISFWHNLRRLIEFGIFHENCMGGVLGQSITKKPLRDLYCFFNPLWQSKLRDDCDQARIRFLTQLVSYNILRKRLQKDYSNANMLLKELLPRAPSPPLFSYKTGKPRDGLISFETKWHRTFLEISFLVNRELLKTKLSMVSGKHRMPHEWSCHFYNDILKDISSQHHEDASPSYVCGVPNVENAHADTEIRWAESIHQQIIELSNKECESIHGSGKFEEGVGLHGTFHPSLVEVFKRVLDRDMIATVLWLGLIDNWKTMVIFPELYWYSGEKRADDAAILFYSSDLLPEELQHEHKKVELIYQQRGGKQIQTRAEESAGSRVKQREMDRSGHEQGKIYGGILDLIGFHKSLFLNGHSQMNLSYERLLWQLIEAALGYGLVWASYSAQGLPLSSRPWNNDLECTGRSIEDYVRNLALYGWQIAILRDLIPKLEQGLHNDGVLVGQIESLFSSYPENNLDIKNTGQFNSFNHTGFSNGDLKVSYELFRWIVVALHNAWQHCRPTEIRNGNSQLRATLTAWQNYQNYFSPIIVKIEALEEKSAKTSTISVTNPFDVKKYTEDVAKFGAKTPSFGERTGLALFLVAQELWEGKVSAEQVKDHIKFGPSPDVENVWETVLRIPNIALL